MKRGAASSDTKPARPLELDRPEHLFAICGTCHGRRWVLGAAGAEVCRPCNGRGAVDGELTWVQSPPAGVVVAVWRVLGWTCAGPLIGPPAAPRELLDGLAGMVTPGPAMPGRA